MIAIDYTEKILVALRVFVIQFANVSIVTFIMHQCLYKRNSYKLLVLWQLFRIIIINGLLMIVLEEVRLKYILFQNTYAVIYCIASFVTTLVYLYTFKDIAKTILLFFVCEFPTVLLSLIALLIVGIIEGRSYSYMHPFVLEDLLIIPFDLIITTIFVLLFRKKLNSFREYKLRHPGVWVFVSFAYVIPSALMTVMNNVFMQVTRQLEWGIVTLGFILVYLLVEKYLFWQKQVKFQNNYLTRQKELQMIHYESIHRQIMQMEHAQQLIDEQMKSFVTFDEQGTSDDILIEYLLELKHKREEIKAGVYCNDWIVDAVLCHYSKQFTQSEIVLNIQMQKYDRGKISEEDFSEILMIMFEYLITNVNFENKQNINLHISRIKNYLVINIDHIDKIKEKKLQKLLKDYLLKYNGSLHIDKFKQRSEGIEIVLQTE